MRQVNTGYGRPTFSKIEIRDIIIAVLVLSIAFTIMLRGSYLHDNVLINYLMIFLVSLILVICSFMLHELGHKFTAQKFGAWSEFRMWPAGLGLCIIMSFLGFLFAAPGAVYINGYIDDRMNGKISAAGPIVNIVIGAFAFIFMIAFSGSSLWYSIFYQLAHLNAFLALFNMLPIGPLDGAKVLRWNPAIFIALIGASVALLFGIRMF